MANNSPSSLAGSSYDETPYPAASHPQTHPNRVAAIARLFGIEVKEPSQSRVLELGCADGANLLPMADQYPNARFLGLDASKVQIAEAQKAVAASGLKNVEVRHQDILEFTDEGKFDYIIVHGIFSWVPPAVRTKILSICETYLAEQGVAYISYNALPGWNMRRSLRDMMLFHTGSIAEPKQKVQQARALLAFLAESVPVENSAYGMLLKSELEFVRGQHDSYLFHEFLEEHNVPMYFHEFTAMAGEHGLQYLGEPGIAQMLASNFPEKVRDTLGQASGQIIRQEQYMDFLRNRMFRQTLLCRKGLPVDRNITPQKLEKLSFRSLLKQPEAPVDLAPGVKVGFNTVNGFGLNTADSFVKALLLELAESGGASAISYANLLDLTRLRSHPYLGDAAGERAKLGEATLSSNLLNLLAKGFIEPYVEPVSVVARHPAKPSVSALVRYQAMNARYITNRMHQPLPADVLGRYVVGLCDGTRTRDDLVGAVITYVKQGKLAIKEGNNPITDIQRLREVLAPRVDGVLHRMTAGGFFNS